MEAMDADVQRNANAVYKPLFARLENLTKEIYDPPLETQNRFLLISDQGFPELFDHVHVSYGTLPFNTLRALFEEGNMIFEPKLIVFTIASPGIAWISRISLCHFRSQSVYRFFAWEAIPENPQQ